MNWKLDENGGIWPADKYKSRDRDYSIEYDKRVRAYTFPSSRSFAVPGDTQEGTNETMLWLEEYIPMGPSYWRCDGCRHANAWEHLSCPHCGAQLPERYDE